MKPFTKSPRKRRDDANAPHAKRTHLVRMRPMDRKGRAGPPADLELFLGLTEEDSRKVIRHIVEKKYPRGTTIFRKNDPVDSLYVLKEGVVKLVARSKTGAGTILYMVRPTEIFGELLLTEARRPFNALAVTDVLAGFLSRVHLLELLASVPRFRMNFIRILSRRLAHVEKGVTEFSHARSRERLARILIRMCIEHGEEIPGGVLLRLPLTHADLADMIGTTRETVTNQLRRFSRLGFVGFRGHRLVVNRRRLGGYVRSWDIRGDVEGIELEKSA